MTALALVEAPAKAFDAGSVRRTMDPTRLNVVANDPSVFPHLGYAGTGPIDLSAVIDNPANVAIESDHGGFVAVNQGSGQYEVHSLFLPEGRGGEAAAVAQLAFRFMFTATDCLRAVTKVPASNRAAAALARIVGFKPVFERKGAWADGADVSFHAFTHDAWVNRDPTCLEQGGWFHDQLEAAKIANGSALEVHEDDHAHDRAVGAAVLTIRAGNPVKALTLYNQQAALAGFAPLSLLSLNPVVIDVVDAIVAVAGESMEVLKCR